MQGNVKWFDATKGYGFIKDSNSQKEVFVHISEVQKAGLQTLSDGQAIEFETQDRNGRIAACNLKLPN